MTVAEARRLLGVKTDYKLAQLINRNRASVSRWGRMVPESALEDIGKAWQKLSANQPPIDIKVTKK